MDKILLVEDDINLREIYAARLSAEGYELVVASDGEEALSKAVAEKPKLILLDVMMPKISGFDVLDILRSTEETKHTKVVMLSALSQESDRDRGEKLGADKYLIKSQITLEDVVETVKSLVGNDGGSTPIVTTTSGRLPSDNQQTAPATDQAVDTNGLPPQDASQPAASQQPATDQPQTDQTPTTQPPSQTASEIDHIDNAMRQDNA